MIKYIDATPTWEAMVPVFMVVLENGTPQGRAAAEQELRRMAKLADLYVTSQRSKGNAKMEQEAQ